MKKTYRQLTAWSSAILFAAAVNSASALTYDTDTTLSASPAWSEDVTITSGVSVTFGQNILPGQTTDLTVTLDGSLIFNNTLTDSHAVGNSLVNTNNQALKFTGSGSFILTGTGRLAMQSNNYKGGNGYSVCFEMADGALIDIQKGTLVNGGYAVQNWTNNKADIQIASGASLDIWDGAEIRADSLVGSGSVITGQGSAKTLHIGKANSTWLVDGVQTTPEFSGTFIEGKLISLNKYGTGTQILSGAFLSTGTVTVSEGTLLLGNGTNGYIGTNANLSVSEGAVLTFNSTQATSLQKTVTSAGTINLQQGFLEIVNSSGITGAVNVSSGAHLALGGAVSLDKFTTADGSTLSLYVNSADETTFTVDTFNSVKSARPNVTVNLFAPTGKTLSSAGVGNLLENGTSVYLADGGTLLYDNGAGTETTVKSLITGLGSAAVNSGKVIVNSATPANGSSRFAFPQITINDGGHLVFDNVVPQQTQNTTFTINAGGVLEFIRSNTPNTGANESAGSALTSISSGIATVNGAGTLRVTGQDYLYACGGSMNFVMAMASGGLLDIQGGEFVNGGYPHQNWTANKGSVNIAEGACFNLWDGSDIYIDGLTGKGDVIRGTRTLILGQDNHSTFENQTALFEGMLCGSAKHGADASAASSESIRKVGTGTQILAGDSNYTGTTEVQAGILQFGNGGATGKIGTGNANIRGGELKFNTTRENTVNNLNGYGTFTSANSGKVTVTSNPNSYAGTINAETENSIIEFAPAEFASAEVAGSITGKGTVSFKTNADSTLKLASTPVSEETTVQVSGGNVLVGSGLFNGTLKAVDNVTLTMPRSYTGTPYTMTLYEDNADADGRITPTTDPSSVTVKVYDEKVFDMAQAANNGNSTSVAAYIPNDYAALSYTNTITVLKDLTLDFGGQFDDRVGVWVKPLDANGNPIEGAEWQTLMGYHESVCVRTEALGVSLPAGNYLLDVRVSEHGGGQVAQARDAYNNFMGVGLRLNGTNNWLNFDVNTENGFVGLLDGSIVSGTAKTEMAFGGDLDIAEGKTLTFDNPHAAMGKYDIDSTVTGTGTLKFTDSANSNAVFDVNIDSEGSLVFAEGVDVGLTVNLESLNTVLSAESILFEGTNELNVYLKGEAPENIDIMTLIETPNENTLVGLDLSAINIFADDDSVRWFTEMTNGALKLTIGNSNALPEPSAWILLLGGTVCLLKLRRKSDK